MFSVGVAQELSNADGINGNSSVDSSAGLAWYCSWELSVHARADSWRQRRIKECREVKTRSVEGQSEKHWGACCASHT